MKRALTIIASVALFLFAIYEVLFGIPVAWWLYASLVPLFALGLLRVQPPSAQLGQLAAFLAIVAAIAALYFVTWTTRKPFLRDLYSIKTGMTEADVRRIMARYMEGTGWPAIYGGTSPGTGTLNDLGTGATHVTGSTPAGELTIENSLVFRHSNDGAFNSDWGIVAFKNGRVTYVSFSPD